MGCSACGMSKGPKGCRPAARSLNLLQGMRTPEQACSEARIPFSEAHDRFSGLDAPGDDAFFRACVIECPFMGVVMLYSKCIQTTVSSKQILLLNKTGKCMSQLIIGTACLAVTNQESWCR